MAAVNWAALGDRNATRIARAAATIAAAHAGWSTVRSAWATWRTRTAYTVSVPGDDDVYEALHEWLLGQMPPAARRALVARTGQRSDGDLMGDADDGDPKPPRVTLLYDSKRSQTVTLDGHRVDVEVTQESDQQMTVSAERGASYDRFLRSRLRIVLTSQTADGRDACVALVQDLAERRARAARRPQLRVADRWGSWVKIPGADRRPLESVVLAAGQRERLVADLGRFLDAEDRYKRLGVPWHRGYLLHGPPGTGKTSTATALAWHYGLDVYLLSLSDLPDDANLIQTVGQITSRSMLVLEDVDVAHAAGHRDDNRQGVTLSGLLNALDGIATPSGLVTVLTTNADPEQALDEALRRSGRVDVTEHLGPVDSDQVERLLGWLAGVDRLPVASPPPDGLTPADVVSTAVDDPADIPDAARLLDWFAGLTR